MDDDLFVKKAPQCTRSKIELSLLHRYESTKRKLDKIKKKSMQEQLKHNQAVPTINPLSRRLAGHTKHGSMYSPNRLERTREILRNSRFMPKKVKLSLHDLQPALQTSKRSSRFPQRYESTLSSPREYSPVTFPSLQQPSRDSSKLKCSESINVLPPDIAMRNELLFGLRKEASQRGFVVRPEEPPISSLGFHERTKKWLMRKEEKIKQMQEKNEKKATVGCTFKPELRRVRSTASTQRTLSSNSSCSELNSRNKRSSRRTSYSKSERNLTVNSKSEENTARVHRIFNTSDSSSSIYNGLCPVAMDMKYYSGYSNSLKKRSKPMFDYKNISINA